MTSGYLLESDYLEAIKMTSITTAKMEKLDEKTEIEEGNFDKKESEECTKINTAIVAKGEYVDVCKMARDNVYKVEFVKNCVKVGPKNLEGLIVKGEHPVKEYTEEDQCPAGTRTRPATRYFFRYPTRPDSVLEIIG